MKMLMTVLPFVVPAVSIGAALTVVSVATLRTLRPAYPRPTAVVLALGVTVLALVGTAPVILVPSSAREPAGLWLANASALMLLPFLTLAVSRLLCDLLVVASGRVSEEVPRPADLDTAPVGTTAAVRPRESKDSASHSKPRGRPKKQKPQECKGEKQILQTRHSAPAATVGDIQPDSMS